MSETETETPSAGGSAASPSVSRATIPRTQSNATRGMLVVGGVALIALVIGFYAWSRNRNQMAEGRAQIASIQRPTGAEATDPTATPSPAYQELIAAENAQAIGTAEANPYAVVVPPMVGGDTTTELPEPAPTQAAATAPVAAQATYGNVQPAPDRRGSRAANGEASRRKLAALEALGESWSELPAHETHAGTWQPPAPAMVVPGVQAAPARPSLAVDLPLATVIPALVEVGANTDYPGETVFRLSGAWSDVKLLGSVANSVGNGPTDRLVMRVDRLVYDGEVYDVEGFAVDPATRIPAIKGDTNRHLLYNITTQSAAAFLAGFGAGTRQQRIVATDGDGVFLGGLSAASLLQQEGAATLGSQLNRMQYRRTTVTLPAGAAVGIVLTALPGDVPTRQDGGLQGAPTPYQVDSALEGPFGGSSTRKTGQ